MAGWRGWISLVTMAALLAIAAAGARAQSRGTGALAGTLTDLNSTPLEGATLVARNEATGAEWRTKTGKKGSYRFVGLAAGEYTLEADSDRLGRGRLSGIVVAAGHEAHVLAAMRFEPATAGPVQAVAPTPTNRKAPELTAALHPGDKELPPVTPVHAPAVKTASGGTPALATADKEAAEETPSPHPITKELSAESPVLAPLIKTAPEPTPAPQPVDKQPSTATPAQLSADKGPPAVAPAPHPADKKQSAETPVPVPENKPAPELTSTPHPADKDMPTETLVATGALLAEPLLRLPLPQQSWAGGRGLAVSEAAGALMQAALENSPAPAEPIQAQSEDTETVTPTATTAVTAAQLQAVPLAGRRWQEFVLDTPTAAAGGGTSLRGGGQQSSKTTIDGSSNRLAYGGAGGAGPESSGQGTGGQGGADQNGLGRAWSGGRGSVVAGAAIRQVQTAAGNSEAQGARFAGGRMNIETQRGFNGLHGQASLFDRQNSWGAQNPFTQWEKETAPATEVTTPVFTPVPYTPPDHEMTWGLGVGSQIVRDKVFWFGALDNYQRNDPGLAMARIPNEFFLQPTNDQMQVLSARLGLSGVNPVAEGLAAYSKMLETLDGLLGPSPRTASQWVGFSRIDWQAAERHRFTLEGIGARWNSPGGGMTRVSETYGTNSFGSSHASQEWLLGRWEAFLTPNLLAVTQGSVGRTIQNAHAETPSAFEQTFLSPSIWGQLPQMVVDPRYGFTIGNPTRFGPGSYPDERLYEGQEMFEWVKGNLLVKAGFDLSHNSDATGLLRNQTGTYTYASPENFVSDALVFAAFGLSGELNPYNQHNCDETGKVWRDTTGQLRGLGYLPCYSYYSQTMGPSNWHLSTNDWASYVSTQWQPRKLLVFSAGLRWELEQVPPPIAGLANPELPLTHRLPSLGSNWGPRLSMALGNSEEHWPVLRLGYGMYFGRTENATFETALTQTGSPNGDLNFFMRPTDNLTYGGAPPFPYVLAGEPTTQVKPGAVEFQPGFRNPEVQQGMADVEEMLPGRVELTASAMVSLGRRLPISIDTNFDPALNPGTITYGVVDGRGEGPIKSSRITVPFYASWPSATSVTGFAGRLNPDYQQISQIMSRANSTYEAAMLNITRFGRNGLGLRAHYTYAHAMDWNPNESTLVAGSDVLDPAHFSQEYGTSNLDVRHSAAAMVIYQTPWKLQDWAGQLVNGWMLAGVGQYRSGLPFTMRASGSLAEEFDLATGAAIVGLAPGMNGSGGDSRVYGVGRNTFRYPPAWKADARLGKNFNLGAMRQLELMVESFNLFNHENVTELETTGYYLRAGTRSGGLPTLNFLTGLKPNTTAFGQPLNINATNFYRERQIQVGLRFRF